MELILIHEMDNPHDPRAIAFHLGSYASRGRNEPSGESHRGTPSSGPPHGAEPGAVLFLAD